MNRDDYQKIEEFHSALCEDLKADLLSMVEGDYIDMVHQIDACITKGQPVIKNMFEHIFGAEFVGKVQMLAEAGVLMGKADDLTCSTESEDSSTESEDEAPGGHRLNDFGHLAAMPSKAASTESKEMSHPEACRYVESKMPRWGGFSDVTEDRIQLFAAGLEKWFDEEEDNLRRLVAKGETLDRFNCGYDAGERAGQLMKEDFSQDGFEDTEGGMAVSLYVNARLGVHQD